VTHRRNFFFNPHHIFKISLFCSLLVILHYFLGRTRSHCRTYAR
jgi:hypothetical protein